MQKWQCGWSPTLGALENTHQEVWGTDEYTDQERPTVFFGLYGLPDFYTLWRHQGERHILWAGSDITHLKNHYWLEDGGGIRVDNKGICEWINKHCTNWCENKVEAQELMKLGIYANIQPSFLGDINDFELSFKPGNKVYASVSGDNFELYGWDKIEVLAKENPEIEFHLYGNNKPWPVESITSDAPYIHRPNIFVHGRVPKEQMNAEIKEMQGGLRMTEFDGFSEILAKSILWGQWPISLIEYPHILKPNQLWHIVKHSNPNIEGREYYLTTLNQYPWNTRTSSISHGRD